MKRWGGFVLVAMASLNQREVARIDGFEDTNKIPFFLK
jgi:hypothetical protein